MRWWKVDGANERKCKPPPCPAPETPRIALFSEELFKKVAETYRRLRNIFRFLLGNLSDFDAARHALRAVRGVRGVV